MSNFTFQSMTPCDNVDLNGYKEAFEYAFSNIQIRNIALTGSYGSGKSSVLESYKNLLKKQGKTYKFMHISMAKFDHIGTLDSNFEMMDERNRKNLEGKILNQLVYQLSDSVIRKSPIHMSVEPEQKLVKYWILGICTFLLSFYYFLTLSKEPAFTFPFELLNCIISERRKRHHQYV